MTEHYDGESSIEKLISDYNKSENVSITWSPKEQRFKLHYKVLTPVTVEQINEHLITSKIKRFCWPRMTVFSLLSHGSRLAERTVSDEERKYSGLPWVDEYIDDDELKYFYEKHDMVFDYVYWSKNP